MVQNAKKQSKKKEHILVGLSSAPSNSKIVETASKMARAFDANLTALYIKTSQSEVISEENAKRLQNNIKFAERMGATIVTVYGEALRLHHKQLLLLRPFVLQTLCCFANVLHFLPIKFRFARFLYTTQ